MAMGCLIAGKIVCGGGDDGNPNPLAGVSVDITLLDVQKKKTKYKASATSDANGDWAVSIGVAPADKGELVGGRAEVIITCPNGKQTRLAPLLTAGKAGEAALKKMVEKILIHIGEGVLEHALHVEAKLIPVFLTTEFFGFVAWGTSESQTDPKPFDCCAK